MSNFTVIYDACVLYPSALRSFLMYLAVTDLFRARWSNQIHDEWTRSVLANYPDVTQEQLVRTRTLMDRHVRGCLVSGFEELIPSLELPDLNDRHVLAAAIHCGASVIVTSNLRDFPDSELSKYEIEAQHPDEFCSHLLDLSPMIVCEAARRQRHSMKNPPKTVDEYLQLLEAQGLMSTVKLLRERSDAL